MKKAIEQGTFKSVEVDKREFVTFISQYSKITVDIDNSKAREVALSICPELGEPTIKTDNTKVILHLESELKEAVELIEKGKFLYESLAEAGQISITDPKKITESINAFNAFLTKHKSKE